MLKVYRRAVFILIFLAIPAIAPAAADQPARPADPAMPHLAEPKRFLTTPGRMESTLVLPGTTGEVGMPIRWELLVGGQQMATGLIAGCCDGSERNSVVLSVPLPEIAEPAGMELAIDLSRSSGAPLRKVFAFTLYPAEPGRAIESLFGRSTVALYDPEQSAAEMLASLGLRVRSIARHDELLDDREDLIVVGTGGFSRGQEALGPILAQRARNGTPVLLLDQPSLPGTFTHRLRLWPSFARGPRTDYLLASGHPAFEGSSGSRGAAYLASGGSGMSRPYLPPTDGNFRVLAEMRVKRGPVWQEGVRIVEFPIGRGTVVAAQTALASDFAGDAGARILLINLLTYLLSERPQLRRTFLYGPAEEALPACLADLAPDAPPAPADLQGVELLIVPADWQAPRRREHARTAPPADVGRFLHDGGTVLLVDPQPLVAGYLSAVLGETVEFNPFGRPPRDRHRTGVDRSLSLLQGIASEDLRLLDRQGEREFLLRSHRATRRFEPQLLVSGLSLYRVGRGSLVALAMPRSVDCGSPRSASLLARLLTNLGVPLDVDGGEIDPRVTRLDH